MEYLPRGQVTDSVEAMTDRRYTYIDLDPYLDGGNRDSALRLWHMEGKTERTSLLTSLLFQSVVKIEKQREQRFPYGLVLPDRTGTPLPVNKGELFHRGTLNKAFAYTLSEGIKDQLKFLEELETANADTHLVDQYRQLRRYCHFFDSQFRTEQTHETTPFELFSNGVEAGVAAIAPVVRAVGIAYYLQDVPTVTKEEFGQAVETSLGLNLTPMMSDMVSFRYMVPNYFSRTGGILYNAATLQRSTKDGSDKYILKPSSALLKERKAKIGYVNEQLRKTGSKIDEESLGVACPVSHEIPENARSEENPEINKTFNVLISWMGNIGAQLYEEAPDRFADI